ncbi:MAG: ComEA family DNA-binding protein [Acidobacteriota bacterium]
MTKLGRLVMFLAVLCALAAFPRASFADQAAKHPTAAAKSAALVDINTASEAELKALPGIGDAYAAKIVQNRPYKSKADLERKNVIPKATYDKVKSLIIAKQPAK